MIKRELLKKSNQVKVTFVQPYDGTQAKIAVVGDFNNWDPKANPLIKRTNGTASASITLDPHQRLRFRYFSADGKWFNDEAADAYEPGEHGDDNSVVIV